MLELDSSQLIQSLQVNHFGERFLYSIHRNRFSNIASTELYKQEFKNEFHLNDMLYIIIGADSGLLLNYLFDNPPSKGSTFIFIDFTAVIEKTLIDFIPDKDKRIFLTDYQHWQQTAEQFGLSDYLYINRVKVIQSFSVKDNFIPQYKQLWKQIEEEVSDLKWQHLAKAGSKVFIQTQLINLNENQFSVSMLANKLEGKTAVMLAGGPSLDLYLDWVEQNREKFVVLAVSRIAKRLMDTNIKPDFFIAIDPNDSSFDVSKEVLNFYNDSILLHQYHLSPKIVSQWQGTNFYIGARYPWLTSNQPPYLEAPGPTVTNVALHVAIFMGISKIILIGVDLCFSPKGYSHASGSIEHTIGPMSGYVGQLVKTNDGRTAETENSLFNAINILSSQAEYAIENGCHFINPSPNAAKVENIEYVPIEKIELTENIESPVELINQSLPGSISDTHQEYYQEVIKELEKQLRQLKKIINLTQKGLSYNKQFFKNNQPEQNFRFKIKMDRLEKQLDKKFGYLSDVCKSYGIQYFLRFIKPAHDKDMDNDEIKEWGEIYYNSYKIGAMELERELKAAIKRSKNRIKELNPNKQINRLLAFWISDRSPGRAEILKNQHADIYNNLAPTLKNEVDKTISFYQELISSSFVGSGYYHEIQQMADLNGGEAKAYELFSREDKEGLKRMIDGLSEYKDNDQAESLKYLAHGYLSELNSELQQAVGYYQNAGHDIALESALKRLTIIALQDKEMEMVELALTHLSNISLAYLPQLADIYKLHGKYQEALETYAVYLENFPEDIIHMLKLAALYQELENNEGAKFVYEHILSIEPENTTAKLFFNQLQ